MYFIKYIDIRALVLFFFTFLINYYMGMNINYIGKLVVRFPGTTSSVCADMSNSSLVTFWRQI